MKAAGILGLFLIFYRAPLCASYANLSSDYRVTRTTLSPVLQDYADRLLEISEDMPRPCRKDICYASATDTFIMGILYWPEVTTSQKVELRCPFSFEVPVYATRVCGLNMQGAAQWEEADFQTICPEPPLAELLKVVKEEVYEAEFVHYFNNTGFKILYSDILRRFVDVFTRYRDTPMMGIDIINLMKYYFQALTSLVMNNNDTLSVQVAGDILSILNTLMDKDIKGEFAYTMYKHIQQFPAIVEKLPHIINKNQEETLLFIFPNIVMHVININADTPDRLNITDVFTVPDMSNANTTTPNISVDLSTVDRGSGDSFDVCITIFRDGSLLHTYYKWQIITEGRVEVEAVPEQFTTAATDSTDMYLRYAYDNLPPNISQNVSTEHIPTLLQIPHTWINLENVNYFEEIGSIIYLSSSLGQDVTPPDIRVMYAMYDSCNDSSQTDNCLTRRFCVKGTNDDYTNWSTRFCDTTQDKNRENGFTFCHCPGLGSFGVFSQLEFTGYPIYETEGGGPYFQDELVTVKQADISSFLGFDYQKGIEILGNVFCFISLACLIATVASYAMFRRTRKGSPTTVLLNLCAALICLSLLLLILYFAADVMTITGCTVTNTLRYYLVFVTLVWNGIEAFNMYMMLVRVFNSDISKFGIKAGVIAWGVPLLMLGVCFGVNHKSFNGEHILISAELGQCVYRCQLRDNTLYYGFLIPMGVIITHNFIMFGFVLKAILKHGNQLGKNQKKNRVVQLIGAVATLVLLGVPWIFSAFGAMDAKHNPNLEGTKMVFQVIFVTLVNLQGVFIFVFHCARNTQVRKSWSSVVSKTLSTAGGSTSRGTANNSNVQTQSVKLETKSGVNENKDGFNSI